MDFAHYSPWNTTYSSSSRLKWPAQGMAALKSPLRSRGLTMGMGKTFPAWPVSDIVLKMCLWHVWVFYLCVWVLQACSASWGQKRVVAPLKLHLHSFVLPCQCWELKQDPLEEQLVLSLAKPRVQPQLVICDQHLDWFLWLHMQQ